MMQFTNDAKCDSSTQPKTVELHQRLYKANERNMELMSLIIQKVGSLVSFPPVKLSDAKNDPGPIEPQQGILRDIELGIMNVENTTETLQYINDHLGTIV